MGRRRALALPPARHKPNAPSSPTHPPTQPTIQHQTKPNPNPHQPTPIQVAENEVVQLKKFLKEQDDIKHIKEFIASCGTYSNLVKQAKSKQKM